MIGQSIAQYKVLEKLGAGGMGEVFLAEDSKLKRKVALKFLPDKLSSDPEFKSRFEHEAQAAAALNHPNIITVYDLGEYEGRLFIAMEHVTGKTLAALIDSDELSVRKSLDLAVQICDGLGAAHNAGIVHRDIKPANILIDDSGRARILDFGLAKSRRATTETKIGSTVGTVQYESPEQSRGERVDNRSDLFSFGSVLYEMITGKLPFPGDYDEAIRYSISHEPIEPLARYKSGVPADLESVIAKLLEKEPEMRYQTASGVIADLKRIQRDLTQSTPAVSRITPAPATVSQTAPEPVKSSASKKFVLPGSIVVVLIALALVFKPWKFEVSPIQEAQAREDRLAIMYFDNLTDPTDAQRQGEIVANLLISDISASTQLKVVSSQRLYDILKLLGHEGEKKIDRSIASQVADKANARWMLTGNILRTEPNVVLTAQLVEVETGNVLSSSRIDGAEGEDVFSLVDKLTADVTKGLAVPASTIDESPHVADLTTTSAEAYRYYLEGIDLAYQFKRSEARKSFEKAIELDSTFAMAYFWMTFTGGSDKKRQEVVAKAMQYRDDVSERERLGIEGRSAYLNKEFAEAERILLTSLEKYPDEKSTYESLGHLYSRIEFRDFKKAIEMYEKALEIDPLYKDGYNELAYNYERIDEFDKSIWAINKYIEMAPDEPNPYDSRGDLYLRAGRLDDAAASFREALARYDDFTESRAKLGNIAMWQGDYVSADSIFTLLTKHDDKSVRRAARYRRFQLALHQGRITEAEKRLDFAYEVNALEFGDGSLTVDDVAGKRNELLLFGESLRDTSRMNSLLPEEIKYYDHLIAEKKDDLFKLAHRAGNIAHVSAVLGKRELAREYLERVDSHIDTSIYLMRVIKSIYNFVVLSELGEYDRAIAGHEWLLEGEKVFPLWVDLGRAYLKAGRVPKAVETLERAAVRYDGFRDDNAMISVLVFYDLGRAYQATGWNDKAIEQYEKFLYLWRDADGNLPQLIDAKARLANLKA